MVHIPRLLQSDLLRFGLYHPFSQTFLFTVLPFSIFLFSCLFIYSVCLFYYLILLSLSYVHICILLPIFLAASYSLLFLCHRFSQLFLSRDFLLFLCLLMLLSTCTPSSLLVLFKIQFDSPRFFFQPLLSLSLSLSSFLHL